MEPDPTKAKVPTKRRWPVVALVTTAAFALAAVAVACAEEGESTTEPTAEPHVIPGEDAASRDDASSDGDAPADAGVEAGPCSPAGICRTAIPVDERVSLASVWGSGPSDVWAVGTAGTILHYDGAKWEKADLDAQDAGSPFTLRGVWLDRPDDVWILDGMRLRHTTGWNGTTGTDWKLFTYAQTSAVPSSIAGKDGTIFMTRQRTTSGSGTGFARLGPWVDGGPSLTQSINPNLISLNAVAMGRGTEAWGVGPNRVFRATQVPPTTDGGAPTWRTDEFDSQTTRQLFGVWASESDVWIVGENGVVRHASTSGTPVLEVVATPFDADLRAVFGFDASDVWAVGEQSTILHWNGTSWTKVATPFDSLADRPLLLDVWGSSPNDVWFVGAGVMLHLERTAP
jgi:hypothetical protein